MVDAADTAFSSESKLGMATNAVFLNHVRGIADDEENAVRAYRAKKVFGLGDKEAIGILQGTQENKEMAKGDLVITDDYSVDNSVHHPAPVIPSQPQQNTTLPWVLAAALAAGAGGYALNKQGQQPPITQTPIQVDKVDKGGNGTNKVTGIGSQVELVQPKEPK